MTSYQESMLAIMSNPEDDAARRALAELTREADPELAQFINCQLAAADLRRTTRYRSDYRSHEGDDLLKRNWERWVRDLGFYMGEVAAHRYVEFDRGFPRLCSMNPYLFLEQGEHILTNIAPLRGIAFFDDPEGSPFPMRELAASPLLECLDEIRFSRCKLTEADMAVFASSPHLTRLLVLDVGYATELPGLEALAANPLTRKCLRIDNTVEVPRIDPRLDWTGGPVGEYRYRPGYEHLPESVPVEMSPEGRALERKYGYIPWLHLDNEAGVNADAYYWVQQKVLPRFVPGSPGDAPVPLGAGLYPLRQPCVSRLEIPVGA
jgi:hypothetical protein